MHYSAKYMWFNILSKKLKSQEFHNNHKTALIMACVIFGKTAAEPEDCHNLSEMFWLLIMG